MKRVMKEAMGDCSTTGSFAFSFAVKSAAGPGTAAPFVFPKPARSRRRRGCARIFHALYEQEREAAREKAAAEASEIFSRCPRLRRLVCDRCFLICEDLDLCIACAKTLQVRGNVVAEEAAFPQELPAEPAETIATEGDGST